MNIRRPIGRTKGPGETLHEFTFVAPDYEQALKRGEFVAYQAEVDGRERMILSRIGNRAPLRLYPDAFLLDPSIDSDDVASLLGYHRKGHELYQLTATVIGYYDEDLQDFVNPRLPPRAGWPIYLVTDGDLAGVLTKKHRDEIGAAHVGSLLNREKDRVPVALDLRAITSTHLAVIASTGAGKSYLAAVLVEEMLKPYNRAAVLVIDPHGEYHTLKEIDSLDAFAASSYQPEVQIYEPGEIKMRVSTLTLGDLYYLLPDLSERMEYVLRQAYYDVRRRSKRERGHPERWTHQELRALLRQMGKGTKEEGRGRYASTADALVWRLDSVFSRSVVFDSAEHARLGELFRPGRCTVLQLNEVHEREQQVAVAALLRRLFRARTMTEKEQAREGNDLYLPYPVFVLIEEAHRFAPAAIDVVSKGVIKQVLGEGRKFGLTLGLVSQRPGKLDGDALSLCNTQFILRIINPLDQARLSECVETVGRDLLSELPALTKGQVIIAGEAVNTPILCRVRVRHTPHGAETRDAPAEWVGYFGQDK